MKSLNSPPQNYWVVMHQIRIIVFVQVGKISFVHRFFPQCLRLSATFIPPKKVQNYAEQMSIFTPKTIWLRFIAPNNAGRLTNKCLEIASTNTHTHNPLCSCANEMQRRDCDVTTQHSPFSFNWFSYFRHPPEIHLSMHLHQTISL